MINLTIFTTASCSEFAYNYERLAAWTKLCLFNNYRGGRDGEQVECNPQIMALDAAASVDECSPGFLYLLGVLWQLYSSFLNL